MLKIKSLLSADARKLKSQGIARNTYRTKRFRVEHPSLLVCLGLEFLSLWILVFSPYIFYFGGSAAGPCREGADDWDN